MTTDDSTQTAPTPSSPAAPPAIASEPDILASFMEPLHACGVAERDDEAKLLYLAMTSRLLARPVSVIVKGPSSSGKSFLVKNVLKHFPSEAFLIRSSFSPQALVRSSESLQHRMLVLEEYEGIRQAAEYQLRILMSEGELTNESVEQSGKNGPLKAVVTKKAGPTGLILTTTEISVHPENETRAVSITLSDSPEVLRAVMDAKASPQRPKDPDFADWRALQTWLGTQPNNVTIPFFPELIRRVPTSRTRILRDIDTLRSLIEAHALLHRSSRAVDKDGNVVAEIVDYEVVRRLYLPHLAIGLKAAVSPQVRAIVQAVIALHPTNKAGVSQRQVASHLKVNDSYVSRNIDDAIADGYIVDLQLGSSGYGRMLVPGKPLPDETEVLPLPDSLGAGRHSES